MREAADPEGEAGAEGAGAPAGPGAAEMGGAGATDGSEAREEAAGGGAGASGPAVGPQNHTYTFTRALLQWFDVHGRKSLPWQQDPTPYRVWVSEVMLQQTQVATVIPYYERFVARFPTVGALAAAAEDEVLHLWTGLGYYARARHLRACAQVLVARHGGEFPTDIAAVEALPGIGRSTAGAILALSRGQRHPILDGNVKRVLSRVFGIAGEPGSAAVLGALWRRAEACTPTERVGAYTQAIMDLGATLCTRSRPACTVCPMNGFCVAAREGRQAELPSPKMRRARKAREATLLIAESGADGTRAILVERRPAPGIWGGLWSPPQFESEFAALDWCRRELGEPAMDAQRLSPIDHAFTHFDLRLTPVRVRVRGVGAVHTGGGARGGENGSRKNGSESEVGTERGSEAGTGRGTEVGTENEYAHAGARAAAAVHEREWLWYSLAAPPAVGLAQPIRRLFDRLAQLA